MGWRWLGRDRERGKDGDVERGREGGREGEARGVTGVRVVTGERGVMTGHWSDTASCRDRIFHVSTLSTVD